VQTKIDRYWQQFLASLPVEARDKSYVEAYWFGMKCEDAKEIIPLVLQGIKTSTGSILWSFEADGKPSPKLGDYNIVTDGCDEPVCVLETTEVRILPLDEVDAQFAFDGGEGDRTLVSWRKLYWEFAQHECKRIGRESELTWKIPIICERFRVVYQQPLAT
jgi:uncharacterized protein YhfF